MSYRWWRLVERCEQHPEPDLDTLTNCAQCAQLADSKWVAAAVPAGTPDAFPVVVWEP